MSEVKGVTSDSRASELFLGSESEPQCSLSSLAFFSELPFLLNFNFSWPGTLPARECSFSLFDFLCSSLFYRSQVIVQPLK